MPMRLNQIIAVEKGIKNKSHTTITEVYQKLQKQELTSGISRTYRPKDDDGEKFPPEKKQVNMTVTGALKTVQSQLIELFDVTATKDWANCSAVANVTVDGVTLLEKVPVTYLLFLEKRLTDIHTLIQKLPILDSSESWKFDESQSAWASEMSITYKTKKVPKVVTKAPATDKHPAQVELFTEDQIIGTWETVKFSGAIPLVTQQAYIERVEALQKAVKCARQEANEAHSPDVKIGEKVMKFIFG